MAGGEFWFWSVTGANELSLLTDAGQEGGGLVGWPWALAVVCLLCPGEPV
jgi:hypothetical protein